MQMKGGGDERKLVRPTPGGNESGIERSREKRIGQIAEELLEDGANVVRIVLLRQMHFTSSVELIYQLNTITRRDAEQQQLQQ